MTHCYNCGHAGTFVLLAEFALAVPGPVSEPAVPDAGVGDRAADSGRRTRSRRRNDRRRRDSSGGPDRCRDDPLGRDGPAGRDDPARRSHPRDGVAGRGASPLGGHPTGGNLPTGADLSFAVQCPVCDSTDVGVAAADLLARYASSTTS